MRTLSTIVLLATALLAAGCGALPRWGDTPAGRIERLPEAPPRPATADNAAGREVTMVALGLIDTGYRFGGQNPEAGLDCSGMVRYIYRQALGLTLTGNAADIAERGRDIALAQVAPGDLVFFNTQGRPYSHVGIYIGDGRFVHAPSSGGQVRIARLDNPYFRQRFDAARTYF